MPKTSYHRVASAVVEMLKELSTQVMKRNVQLTTQPVSPSKKGKGERSRKTWHKHDRRGKATA